MRAPFEQIVQQHLPQVRDWPIRLPRLPLHFSERKLLLALVDLFLVNAALFVTLIPHPRFTATPAGVWSQLHWFVLLSLLWLVLGTFFDLYDLARAASPLHIVGSVVASSVLVGLVYVAIPYVTPALPDRRLHIFILPLLLALAVGSWRLLYAWLLAQPTFHQTALVVGAGRSGQMLAEAIQAARGQPGNPHHGTGYRLLGFVDDDLAKQEGRVAGLPVLGTHQDLRRLVQELHPNELILAITRVDSIQPDLFQAILDCRELGIPITTMATLYERLTGQVPVAHAGRNLEVVVPLRRSAAWRFYVLAHRLIDLAAGALGCLLLGLLVPFVWLANRLTAPGPLFYWQERVGRGGVPFCIVKFRSMVVDAERHSGAVWAQENDPRITPVGRFLRKTRLDEIPQFWNVLKGEMSLIGPRPERPEFVAELDRRIPFYRTRHAVKPGLTGWAQVKYRYGASVEDAHIKLQYDLYYIKHQGLLLDLQILLMTVQVVLGLKGR